MIIDTQAQMHPSGPAFPGSDVFSQALIFSGERETRVRIDTEAVGFMASNVDRRPEERDRRSNEWHGMVPQAPGGVATAGLYTFPLGSSREASRETSLDASGEESHQLQRRFSKISSTVELRSTSSGCDVNKLQLFCTELPYLRQLDLKGLELRLARVEALAIAVKSLPQLEVLIIHNTMLRPEAMEVLAGALKGHAKLRELQAAGNMIGPKGAVAVAAALTPGPKSNLCTSLTALNLSGNQIGWQGRTESDCVEGFLAIAGILKYTPLLTKLDLSCNFMGARSGTVLALEGLALSPSLHTLVLADNGIGAEGAQSLAKALTPSSTNAFNTSLTTLDLAGNAIGPDGARALVQAVVYGEMGFRSCSLRALNLAGNFLGVEGAKVWAEAMLPNSMGTFPLSLTSLDLSGNSLEAEGAKALSSALMTTNSNGAVNVHFHTLNAWGNSVTMEGATALAMAAKRRQPPMRLCGSMLDVWELNLSHRFLAPCDVALLANDLRVTTALKTLDLSGECRAERGQHAVW
ncbi:hypothetical protein CYMTET_8831 [Cymbomonas tetramitiformis]|uniref:Uncharacterized protein n=1 Tax=Cymbomonas tetramitiformis TaxID=36881 RepID=A0AAE0LFG3_9CHLO|nr:hypothetical protein CYMTET_8831 [Cymbomonas tetramitiformis]